VVIRIICNILPQMSHIRGFYQHIQLPMATAHTHSHARANYARQRSEISIEACSPYRLAYRHEVNRTEALATDQAPRQTLRLLPVLMSSGDDDESGHSLACKEASRFMHGWERILVPVLNELHRHHVASRMSVSLGA
jgi:hypothetical protein